MFGRRRLLIVDGGAKPFEEYPSWLMDAGHDCSVVDDAARASIIAPLLRPDVILVDLEYVGTNLEWVRRLQSEPSMAAVQWIGLAPADFDASGSDTDARELAIVLARPLVKDAMLNAVRVSKSDPPP